jgi:RimJ/RimL family protein N-acetyltransferase
MNYEEYFKVKELFRSMDYQLDIESIFLKKRGQIFVDNRKMPQTACIYNDKHNFYIAGRVDNREFNQNLYDYMTKHIFPSMLTTDCLDFYIDYGNQYLWKEEIRNIFEQNYVSSVDWRYYMLDKQKITINLEVLPEDYKLKRIDEELLKRSELKNIDDITEWTSTDGWLSQQDFLKNGFGFCIIKGKDIVSWSIADYVIGNSCEIGIETDEDYRRKGFAAIVATACVKFALSNGIDRIGWHCFESNIASQKTAEKIGFKLRKKYAPIFGWFNSFDNYLVQAYECYNNKNYIQASKLYENAFLLIEHGSEEVKLSRICNKNNKYWFYYNAARCHAHSGNDDLLFRRLRTSIELGLSNIDMIIKDDAFKVFEKTEEYNQLLDKIR